ncbi:peptide ABC transporter [Alkalihalobacillus alcalophilus ATCC 27647 = CGMCC 1.3604]|uniref:Dipeptide/oligopeptide transporter n=1 Tax=Alkalihalobacillus alcalophilus ATCC 27647 = CGMCC 1.3604 TaxID=1218173 RepID=J8TEL7_ALKAL|nr:ABC transporter permease [Alkalihalobacillus alcalophilus]AFV25668.1 dipeptide/oligopeptide transporter [Alkalihalobacillus alcalophilus ATCC 27647 = CGMCC 1.3604]MED1562934.1 ABC transporter permease [Alkalihalobacillus alcalophilus]THG91942.1 peptide ABC transporter [Alkalihalobacillus alcalophilus ATCC 27647 = CGMCC 1.3604]
MLKFILRRVGLMGAILFLVSVIIFSLVNVLPGDPATLILGQEATPEALESLREEMGLNQPLIIQYFEWVTGVLQGDFGHSIRDNTPVTTILVQKIPVTLQLTIMSFFIAIMIAVPVGIISATRKGTLWDYSSTLFALSGVSIPPFFLGILLIFVFAVTLGWLPPSGYVPLSEDFTRSLMLMILPAITIGIRLSAELTRMLRSSLLEVLQADFIRTGYAKGLLERGVVFGHAFRNALIPVITVSGLQMATFLGGAVITETIFAVPGIGQLVVTSILTRDFPVVQGAVMFMAFAVILINFMVDILYTVLDPRIKLAGGTK